MYDDEIPLAPFKRNQDLFHAFILLVMVSLLFFAALKLVAKSTDIVTKSDPASGESETDSETQKGTRPVADNTPQRVAWLNEIKDLEQRVDSLRSIPSVSPNRRTQLQQRLEILRRYFEQLPHSTTPKLERHHPLRLALQRISEEIGKLAQSVLRQPAQTSWKEDYAQFEANRQLQFDAKVNAVFDEWAAPVRQSHQDDVAKVTRDIASLRGQIQSLHEKELHTKDRTNRELARLERLQKFEPVRAEALRILLPFISPDYAQPGRNQNDWVTTPDKKPVSWNALQRMGALETTLKGLETLMVVGAQYVRKAETRRPYGSFPVTGSSTLNRPNDIEMTKRAQSLLIEHKQVLIEEGLLSP